MREYGEFDFIDGIRDLFSDIPKKGFEGIGDDCAVLSIGDDALVFTSDMLNEGVHFLADKSTAYQIGYKSLMVNISDVAAMGAKPVATLLSLALPKERFGAWSNEFMKGYHEASKKYGVKLVGGDTTKSESGVCISVTAIGRAPKTNIKRRSAAKTGDVILVTGELGASATGLRDVLAGKLRTRNAKIHLMPEAQVREGEWLGSQEAVHAMCDISDGIASDLQHIVDESKRKVVVLAKNIPIAKGATWSDAFGGGEDYKLLMTVDPAHAEELMKHFQKRFGTPLYNIGRVVGRSDGGGFGFGLESEDGEVVTLSTGWSGYHHF